MEPCLIDNKICSEQNKRCKDCKLDDCRSVIQMWEEEQKYIDRGYREKLERALPEECQGCSFLVITNLRKQKVYCPYRIKDKCLIKERKMKDESKSNK